MRYGATVITSGTKFVGDIYSSGSLDLQGDLEGNIDILGKLVVAGSVTGDSKASDIYANRAKFIGEVQSKGTVVIGRGSVVVGNVIATEANIAGAVKGDIDVRGPVILDSTAIIKGNIKSQSVKINTGAKIEGLCQQSYIDMTPTSFFDEIGEIEKVEKRKSK
jgi:cytoskeletal protein CcmA (bactofilin family)